MDINPYLLKIVVWLISILVLRHFHIEAGYAAHAIFYFDPAVHNNVIKLKVH